MNDLTILPVLVIVFFWLLCGVIVLVSHVVGAMIELLIQKKI